MFINSVATIKSGGYGAQIFGKCNSLIKLQIPNSVSNIGEELVGESKNVTISGYANSAAAQYASKNSIRFQELASVPSDNFSFGKSELLLMVGGKQALEYSIKPDNTQSKTNLCFKNKSINWRQYFKIYI